MRIRIRCSECKQVMTVIAGENMKAVHPKPGKHYCHACDERRQIAVDIATQAREQAEGMAKDGGSIFADLLGIVQGKGRV